MIGVDHSLVYDNAKLKEECARLLVQTAAEHFSVDTAATVGVPTSDLDGVDKATQMALELLKNETPPSSSQVVTEVNRAASSKNKSNRPNPMGLASGTVSQDWTDRQTGHRPLRAVPNHLRVSTSLGLASRPRQVRHWPQPVGTWSRLKPLINHRSHEGNG